MAARWLPLAVLAAVLAVYLATLQSVEYSDGVHIAAMVSGHAPERYYNWLYVFLGWALHKLLGAPAGWDTWRTLGVLSAVCGAATAALVTRHLLRRALPPASAVAWTLLLAATPGAWFFCTTVEVHSMQLLGCAAATLACLHARTVPVGRAVALVLGASVLALLSHLTSVLLVPTLVALALPARGAPPGTGLDLAPRTLALGALLGALVLFGVLRLGHADVMLWHYVRLFVGRFTKGSLYSPGEVLIYAWDEIVMTMGFLLLSIPLGLLVRRRPGAALVRHLLVALLVAALPFLFVLTQGGIREKGSYYVGLYATLLLLGAEAGRLIEARLGRLRWLVPAAVLLLTAAQGTIAWRAIELHGRAPRAVDWARRAGELCEKPGYVFVSTLPRYHATVRVEGLEASDLRRDFELMPDRKLEEHTLEKLQIALEQHARDVTVYFDADLFRADPSGHMLDLGRFMYRVFETTPSRLEPVPPPTPGGAEQPMLYRLVLLTKEERERLGD